MRQHGLEKPYILRKSIERFILKEIKQLTHVQASGLVKLIQLGFEAAFICRYRVGVHGGLSAEKIRRVFEVYKEAVNLNRKVDSAISTVSTKIVGSNERNEVKERLLSCESMEELKEIMKEYAPGAKKTRTQVAKELGFGPPAQDILSGKYVDIKRYDRKELNHLKLETDCDVRVTVRLTAVACDRRARKEHHAESYGEPVDRSGILYKYDEYGGRKYLVVLSELAKPQLSKSTQKMEKRFYLRDCTVLTLNRGTEDGIITWDVEPKVNQIRKKHPFYGRRVNSQMQSFYNSAAFLSVETYFLPHVRKGIRTLRCSRATRRAIQIFGRNVEQLFCQQGVQFKYVIALDPGSVVKTAFLDPTGYVISMKQFDIYGREFDEKGIDLLQKWCLATCGKDVVIAVGNGTNSYNTQIAVSKMFENERFPRNVDVCYCVVPEHGASIYSCSNAAKLEFGAESKVQLISAVSIGRRLINPMAEYVKIEPEHLGKGQYQLSMKSEALGEKLREVVRSRVSLNGTDLNSASQILLQNVCGLNESKAAEIVKYRERKGRFMSRNELRCVDGIDDDTFQQCAGFLTVSQVKGQSKLMPKGMQWSPFDQTTVHPDDYEVARKLLIKLKLSFKDIADTDIEEIDTYGLSAEEKEIVELLFDKQQLKPPPVMMKKARVMQSIEKDRHLTGTVSNVTDFGLFIDLGVKMDGFIHISHYIKSNTKAQCVDDLILPSVGDQIEVRVNGKEDDGKISLIPIDDTPPETVKGNSSSSQAR